MYVKDYFANHCGDIFLNHSTQQRRRCQEGRGSASKNTCNILLEYWIMVIQFELLD